MPQSGYTPIQIYSSSTPTNAPSAGNLTNDTKGSELAINIADKNLFFKDSSNVVNTVPIRQSGAASDGWLSSTDWNTFNNKQPAGAYLTSVTADSPLSGAGTSASHLVIAQATTSTSGYLSSTDWNTFNGKQAALVSGSNIKTVNGTTLLGSGDLGTIAIAYGGTNATSFTSPASSIAGLTYFDGTRFVNNGTPSRLGFNATSNTFYANTQVTGSANALFAGIGGYTPQIQTHAGDTNSSGFGIFAFTSGGVGRYQINRSKSTTIGTNTALASGDVVGILQYGGADGTGYIDCADIRAYVDGAVSTNVVPGRLSFWTNSGSSVNPVERVRLDSTGKLWQITNSSVTGQYHAFGDGTTTYAQVGGYYDSATTGHLEFYTLSTTLQERMRIFNSGGVSIGNTTDPGAGNLSVTGITATNLNGNLTANNSYYITGLTKLGLNDSAAYVDVSDGTVVWSYTTVRLKSTYYNAGVSMAWNIFQPTSDNACQLGASGLRWSVVYAANGTIQTSDKNAKTEISDTPLGLSFVNALKPSRYKMLESGNLTKGEEEEYVDENGNLLKRIKEGSQKVIPGKRFHEGLIAQDVKKALDDFGVDSAMWIQADDGLQGLRYEELIAPMIKAIQELSAKVDSLETQLKGN